MPLQFIYQIFHKNAGFEWIQKKRRLHRRFTLYYKLSWCLGPMFHQIQ